MRSRGPILADVHVTYEFPQSHSWKLRFRMLAGEPVVLVDEQFALPEGSSYTLLLGKGWKPDRMFHRGLVSDCMTTPLASPPGRPVFLLEPWSPWWGDMPRGNWTSLVDHGSDDLLMIGCREPALWIEPGRTRWDVNVTIKTVSLDPEGDRHIFPPQESGKTSQSPAATFQLRGFARKWMLAALSQAESLEEVAPPAQPPARRGRKKSVSPAPLPQQCLMRYNDVALDTIKDYAFRWDESAMRHPRLMLTAAETDRFRRSFPVREATLARLRQTKISLWQMDEAVAYLVATGDERLARQFVAAAQETLQQAVDHFVLQDSLRTQGTAPHHRTMEVMCSAPLADLVLGSPALKSAERERFRAQLAYLGYTLAGPGFISPERGFSANPNMTTTARGMLGLVACTIPRHPAARRWRNRRSTRSATSWRPGATPRAAGSKRRTT